MTSSVLSRRALPIIAFVLSASLLAACAGSSDSDLAVDASSSTSTTTTANGPESDAAADGTSDVAAPMSSGVFAAQWTKVDAPTDCMCGDGGPWAYFTRTASPTKVLFFLEGGGACFSAETCGSADGYKRAVGHPAAFDEANGVFDLDNPENPFADYSMVFVPYCTGDVHGGNTTTDYGNGVVVQHKGFVNGSAALNAMVKMFPGAKEVVVAGASAGSFPTPVYAGLAADLLPAATVKVVADGSGAIPDAMGIVSTNWKLLEALPLWPEFAGATAQQVTPSWIFEATARHNPKIAFARHDYAFDATLARYARLAGIEPEGLVSVMESNEVKVEKAGASVSTWIAPGDDHTLLSKAEMYSERLNGVAFVDWLSSFVEGSPIDDEHCANCAA